MTNELMADSSFKVEFNPAHLHIENYEEMKKMVAGFAERYDKLVFDEDDKAGLSAARSELLALDKALDTERKKIKGVYNQPLEDFENKVKYLRELIGEPLEKTREAIKAIEDAETELREELLDDYLTRLLEDEDVTIDDLEISDKWTNKGYWTSRMQPTSKLVDEVNAVIASTLKDKQARMQQIQLLTAYCEAKDIDVSGWVGQLEFKDAIQVIADIEAASKPKDEPEVLQDIKDEIEVEAGTVTPSKFADSPFEPPKITNVLQVTGTMDQLLGLRDYLKASGIEVVQVG